MNVIVESHKELRCPECRVLVEARVEELPPNVLLMRILEGMKNSAPRRVVGARLRTAQTQPQVSQQGRSDGKQLPPHGRALYDYISKEPGDLSFKKGEVILLQKKMDAFWYHGECAIIKVERRVDENWAEGRVEQRLGIFPIAFVELNHAARMLLNNTPVNRQVPPIPDQSRNAHSDHRYSQHPQRYQQLSISTPSSAQGNYQNMSALSQSQPSHTNHPSNVNHPPQTLAPNQNVIRNLVEPQTKYLMDIIHFTNAHTMGIQSVSRPNDNTDRIRATKLDSYSQKEYANVRHDVTINFNSNISSDSSSSMNTPSVGSTTTPNTSSNTSTCESAEPSLPSSPDNNTDRNTTVVAKEESQDLNASMGVLSLNESSTATNTSLNVSLPLESQLNVSNASSSSQNAAEANESTNDSGPTSLPCTSKAVRSGPDSLLNFGLGLQAALSPAHSKDSYAMARHRDHREKRHSLTPSTHLQANHTQNRHSAEILATSLLDHTPERDRDRPERERRRRRSRSNERPLPAAYVALYPYKPQKPDELELKKGGVYTVRERCRDGWYKGWCERLQRSGVFPGNYVAPLTPLPTARIKHDKSIPSPSATNTKAAPVVVAAAGSSAGVCAAPDAPPRANSQPLSYPWHLQTQTQQAAARSDKRLAAMKKCKSPPPVSAGYSMDNPVFEDNTTVAHYPVHV
ncbi:unnamed protein product, partial [Leptidea sinapis]